MDWLHEAPSSGKSTAKKNGLTWFWCSKCVRYTSHKSAECTKTTKRDTSKAYAVIASAQVDFSTAGSMVSTADWSEDEEPVKKKKRVRRARKRKSVILSSDDETLSDN